MKYAYFDAEYNNSKAKKMNVVSFALSWDKSEKLNNNHADYWMNGEDDLAEKDFKNSLDILDEEGSVFVSWNYQAESRALLSLGYNPLKLKCIDLYLEYRCLINHNDNLMWGKQLINGKVMITERPEKYAKHTVRNTKPKYNLAAATYKLLGVKIDTDHKDAMRDLIISEPDIFVEEEKKAILDYGASDIKYLPQILEKIFDEYKRLLGKRFNKEKLIKEMYLRSEYAARSAIMETTGYDINYEAVRNFASQVEDILAEKAIEVNKLFPEVKAFRFDPKDLRWKVNTKNIKKWIKYSSGFFNNWERTDTGGLSLKADAWSKHYSFRHDYPKDNFAAQFMEYVKIKQDMNGFRISETAKKTFWDFVGPDKIVRPFLNPYGSQSARTQPSATSFIPLKSAWMRSLIQPPKGFAIGTLDYGSEEFLLSGLLSKDKKMIDAYKTGDVYLAFAKEAKMVPKDATKKSHPFERQLCKATVLGISYDMTKVGLCKKLKMDTGDDSITEDDAQELIDKFNNAYHVFHDWKLSITGGYEYITRDDGTTKRVYNEGKYEEQGFITLPCGWKMWGDNDNHRSVGNCPIQGFGSSIMRKAVALAQDKGLDVSFTLHDALYIRYKSFDFEKINILEKCMREAFIFYFPEDIKELANLIRLDGETWSPDYKELEKDFTLYTGEKVKIEEIHIDERGEAAYHKYKKYFEKDTSFEDL